MAHSPDASGQEGSSPPGQRPPGIWREAYVMPDGSRPVTAIDGDGVLRGVYFMTDADDPAAVHGHLSDMLGGDAMRTNIKVVS